MHIYVYIHTYLHTNICRISKWMGLTFKENDQEPEESNLAPTVNQLFFLSSKSFVQTFYGTVVFWVSEYRGWDNLEASMKHMVHTMYIL